MHNPERDSITDWTPLPSDRITVEVVPQDIIAGIAQQRLEEVDCCLRALTEGVTKSAIIDMLLDRRSDLLSEIELFTDEPGA